MKHFYTFVAAFTVTLLSVNAQSKIDLPGRILLGQVQKQTPHLDLTKKITPFSLNSEALTGPTISRVSPLVVLNDGYTAADISAAGFEVTTDLNSVVVVSLPVSDVEDLAELDCVRQVSFGRQLELYLDEARAYAGVDDIHNGKVTFGSDTYKFTGKGVCTAIFDTGIEPNHINFLNTDGTSRVKQLQYYYTDENDDIYRGIIDLSKIGSFTTDDSTQTHGTHTTGIMAGGYKGTTQYMWCEPSGSSWNGGVNTKSNPYYGVAPESDLLISAGTLADAAVIDGFTRMASYAQENGQPCVINFSAGSITGPHDGTDAFSQAISEVINSYGAIVCMASGNDGEGKISVGKRFTSSDKSLKTCITPDASISSTQCYCILDFWGNDATPFTVNFSNLTPGLIRNTNTSLFNVTAADQSFDYISQSGVSGTTYNTTLKNAYSQAEIVAISEVDPNNKRYHVMALVYYIRKSATSTSASYIHINITGKEGQEVFGTLSNYGEFTAQSAVSGTVDGDASYSISDGCCNPDVISVGSYDNRRYYATLGGNVSYMNESNFNQGAVTYFSSYGPSADGRQLPEVLGPGMNVISSYSSCYVGKNNAATSMSGQATSGSKTHYFASMSGTSMATPFVTGTVALWLEADPTLTTTDVKEIIAKTSALDDKLSGDTEKAGYGRIDPVAGLIEVLSRKSIMGIDPIADDDAEKALIVETGNSSLTVYLAGESAFTTSLYNLQGIRLAETTASGEASTIDTSSLAAGVYIVTVKGASGRTFNHKVMVR
ncbi:MAG: S8 family peptidase [Bacteroides sp.]|nr:S8 family peptidase [Bacteroides sp.]MCM1412857.1 S8 family peptidase [Bacteroides sp.]MCM1471526.1 S8 family peptidase [Bacteroides sp.]